MKDYYEIGQMIANKYAKFFPQLRDELRAEANLAVAKAMQKVDEHPSPESYVASMVKGSVTRFITKHFGNHKTSVLILHQSCLPESVREKAFDNRSIRPNQENNLRLEDCIRDLNPKQREIAKLLIAGYKIKEIGAKLGVKYQNVQYNIKKIRDILKWQNPNI